MGKILLSRRRFIKSASLVTASALGTSTWFLGNAWAANSKKVVVVGGGTAGATAARYLKLLDPSIDVTLIEANKDYYACYMSNEVLGGSRDIASLKFGYEGLKKAGVKVVHDWVSGIDADARRVTTTGGDAFDFDRCIVAPGIDFKYETIEGYDEKTTKTIPHAWKTGSQITLLHKQLKALRNGDTVVITAPPKPYRCPPGPYERASLIAGYLQRKKPKSKVIIIDPKHKFSKMALFTQGWSELYGYHTDHSMIEWHGETDVVSINAKKRTVTLSSAETLKAGVLNVIPAQKAGKIAFDAGLVNQKGWCPVAYDTFESTRVASIHVIGDAIFRGLPKSGYAANSEAKVCAAAVAAVLNGKQPGTPSFANTCYSVIGKDIGISVASVYRLTRDRSKIIKVAGGVSPVDASAKQRKREIAYAHSWFKNITADVFGG